MSEETVAETTEAVAAAAAAAWSANFKEMFEQVLVQTATQAAERSRNAEREVQQNNDLYTRLARQNDDWHALALESARRQAALSDSIAQTNSVTIAQLQTANAATQARSMTNAATVDNLLAATSVILSGVANADAMTNMQTAQAADNSMMGRMANEFQGAVKSAMDSAVAAAVQSNPVNQGTTGVAQGSMQAANAVSVDAMVTALAASNNAIMAQIAKLAEAVAVLTLKVTADATDAAYTPRT